MTPDTPFYMNPTILIPVGVTIIIALVVAAFALGSNRALDKRDYLEQKVDDLQIQSNSPVSTPPQVPSITINASTNPEEVKELSARIFKLENELNQAQSALLIESEGALSPRSELAGLLKSLRSTREEERQNALSALFDLSDPMAIPSMMEYYNTYPKEALSEQAWNGWYYFLRDVDFVVAAEFAINEFEQEGVVAGKYADMAYFFLSQPRALTKIGEYESILNSLKSTALTSSVASARTRAKKLIELVEEQRQEKEVEALERKEEKETNCVEDPRKLGRDLTEIMLDIEDALKLPVAED